MFWQTYFFLFVNPIQYDITMDYVPGSVFALDTKTLEYYAKHAVSNKIVADRIPSSFLYYTSLYSL